jgi:hypothetical protein
MNIEQIKTSLVEMDVFHNNKNIKKNSEVFLVSL